MSSNLKILSRKLRSNMTKEEIILWQRIRRKQLNSLQFYRQKPFGKYIVDFCCPARKLIIEVDGGQHYENGKLIKNDIKRERYLKDVLKYKILRFTNDDITKSLSGVIDKILENI